MKNLIDKYIKKIKIDFPEDDKLMIDLQDFLKEATNNTINLTGSSLQLKDKEALSFEDFKGEFYYKAQMGIYESKATGMFYNLNDIQKKYNEYRNSF